jgi:hypothetical protein
MSHCRLGPNHGELRSGSRPEERPMDSGIAFLIVAIALMAMAGAALATLRK